MFPCRHIPCNIYMNIQRTYLYPLFGKDGYNNMADNRNSVFGTRQGMAPINGCGVVIDTYQVFDSCRDRDCFEDTRVFLDGLGQSVIEHTSQVRTKSAEICSSAISVEPVQLSRGFYRITVRFYVKLELEACVCPGKTQCFTGLAVVEKSVVLYGGEGSVHVFRSNALGDSFCTAPVCGEGGNNLPIAVVETVDPVILGTRVVDTPSECCCCCCCGDVPAALGGMFGDLLDEGSRYLAVSLGFFSVIRIERPEQYLVNAVEFSVPDKECTCNDTGSPCDAFRRMAFPIDEFAPGRIAAVQNGCNSGCAPHPSGTGRIGGSDNGDCGCSGKH